MSTEPTKPEGTLGVTIEGVTQTTDEQRSLVLSVLADMAEDADDLVDFLGHVGFDISALSRPKDLPDAWLGHYRLRQGRYDIDRAAMDLLTWPPVSRRVFELQGPAAKGSPDDL